MDSANIIIKIKNKIILKNKQMNLNMKQHDVLHLETGME